MELKLAANEKVIKSWDYATSGTAFSKKKLIHYNLTLTNKRVVASSFNDVYLHRDEIPVDSIKSVSGDFKKNRTFWAYFKLVLGIPLCLIIVGIKMVKNALETLKSATFDLELTTSGTEGSVLGLGASSGVVSNKKGFFARLFKLKTKIIVNKENAMEIMNEIGAILIDAKEG